MASRSPEFNFASVLSALTMAGQVDLATKLTPDAEPDAVDAVRRGLLAARAPHRHALTRLDFALDMLFRWSQLHVRCACGAPAIGTLRETPVCAVGFACDGDEHAPASTHHLD
jgi:hypothetical protein